MKRKKVVSKVATEMMQLSVDPATMRTSNRESEHREFKLAFDNKDLPRYAKTMVAFANREGGVIFFGIKNSPRELVGVQGHQPDDLVFAHFLKEYFEPEIRFSIESAIYNGKTLLMVMVQPSPDKPIICRKEKIIKSTDKTKPNSQILREGAVYYRYSSSSEEIKYPELRKILDEQVQRVFHSLVSNITLLQTVGYDKAAVVSADELSGDNKTASVYITTETAKNLNWIDKGKFVESADDGEKAFYVVKQVEIKHGVEVPTPTDWSKAYPLTKTALTKEVRMNSTEITAALWKSGILNNPEYHMSSEHGGNMLHKFTHSAKDVLLTQFPLTVEKDKRKALLKKAHTEYTKSLSANAVARKASA